MDILVDHVMRQPEVLRDLIQRRLDENFLEHAIEALQGELV